MCSPPRRLPSSRTFVLTRSLERSSRRQPRPDQQTDRLVGSTSERSSLALEASKKDNTHEQQLLALFPFMVLADQFVRICNNMLDRDALVSLFASLPCFLSVSWPSFSLPRFRSIYRRFLVKVTRSVRTGLFIGTRG